MKLNHVKPLHDKFQVDDLTFSLEDANFDVDGDTVEFSVTDSGGLEVGRFFVFVGDDGAFNYDSHPDYPQTLDRINYRNDSAKISKKVRKTIDSVRS